MTPSIGHNGLTRDEWLYVILSSGEVTRIAQHLALVIYHLSDPQTNVARLSARDLERITGWGRTAILDHLDEIDIYIRVRWGQGRAKALFELQGVVASALEPIRGMLDAPARKEAVRQTDTTADATTDTRADTRADTTRSVRVPDATTDTSYRQPDTTADTNPLCPPAGHNGTENVVQASARRPQWGDNRGESFSSSFKIPPSSARDETPVPFKVHPDGSFSGTAFEHFTATEVAALRATYSFLEFPAELAASDQYLDIEFGRDGTPFGSRERISRLHVYLGKRNRDAAATVRAAQDAMREKARVEPDDSCWFDEDRLMVANGFKAELLALVDGSEARLRTTLDKAAGSVPIELKGTALRKTVRSQFTRFAEWSSQDERKTSAVERRATGTRKPVDPDKPQETDAQRLRRIALEIDAENTKGRTT